MKFHHSQQLVQLRQANNLASVQIDANSFLEGELPLYLFRYAAWALAEGGVAEVTASRTANSMGMLLGRWSFQFVLQSAAKAIDGIATLTAVDVANRRFTFRRHAPSAHSAWSAAVMFSGRDSERPLLETCLASLLSQPELRDGGEIVVCGPAAGSAAVQGLTGVNYLPYETELVAGRFMIGRKKNFALSQLCNEKVLICHTRLRLGQGCLSALPENFDVLTPAVSFVGAKGIMIPYADLLFQRFCSTAVYTERPAPYIGYNRKNWHEHLRDYHPFIDGGLFCTRKSIYLETPLSGTIAWGEGEDVEWARRLLFAGRLLELCTDAHAESLVHKVNYYNRWGHHPAYGFLARLKGYAVSMTNQIRY